jgi:hypothetical protein
MSRWLLVVLVACACACPSKKAAPVTGGGGSGGVGSGTTEGSGTPVVVGSPTCDGIRAKVEQLYRAEAQTKEPKRVDDAVADNTAMVMNDCAKDPAKVAACVAAVSTVGQLERQCLAPLDDEGTEGEKR